MLQHCVVLSLLSASLTSVLFLVLLPSSSRPGYLHTFVPPLSRSLGRVRTMLQNPRGHLALAERSADGNAPALTRTSETMMTAPLQTSLSRKRSQSSLPGQSKSLLSVRIWTRFLFKVMLRRQFCSNVLSSSVILSKYPVVSGTVLCNIWILILKHVCVVCALIVCLFSCTFLHTFANVHTCNIQC